MTIANSSPILKADLDAMTTTQLAAAAADAVQPPLGGEVNFVFVNATAALFATNPERFKASFVAPYDLLLETVALTCSEHTTAALTTALLACPGVLDAFPVGVAVLGVAGTVSKASRVVYDNAGKGVARAVRVIPKGAQVDVYVTTANAVATNFTQVVVTYREFFSRT